MSDEENPVINIQSQKIADSVILTAIARLSMALALPLVGLMFYFGSNWLEQKFHAQDVKMEQMKNMDENTTKNQTYRIDRIESAATLALESAAKINDRLISVETKQTQDAATSKEFQRDTLTRLDRMQDSIVGLSNSIAALAAILQEQNRKAP